MTRGTLFWIIWLALLIVGIAVYWPTGGSTHYWALGYPIANFFLLGLLGWQVFGAAIKG